MMAATALARADHARPFARDNEFAERIDIGGRSLYLNCEGFGSPTVILISGHGADSSEWAAPQHEIAAFTRVCRYDRIGTGWSDPAPEGVRTVQDSVDDLHALLQAAEIPGPYVLLGHSLAGFAVRLYAGQYPEEIAGLVLVDPTPPDFFLRFLPLLPPLDREAELYFARGLDPQAPERIDIVTSGAQVIAAPAPPTIPAVVLMQDLSMLPPDDPFAAGFGALWQELQTAQAEAVHAELIVAEGAGHGIQFDRPDVVLAAVRQVIDDVRAANIAVPIDVDGCSLSRERPC
jgi:pimeloyl-ACP methyl ester carboxylesterase